MTRATLQLVVAVWLTLGIARGQEAAPRVPSGLDPGGVAVALFSTGIDYTVPHIAARLARDGEGEIIAWDFEANDNRPFDKSRGHTPPEWGGDATSIASAMLEDARVRIVAIRIIPSDFASLARAIAFTAQTPARIAVVPMWSSRREDWDGFAQAASHFKDVLFIVAGSEAPDPVFPAALNLENTIAVSSSRFGASKGFGGAARQLSGSPFALAAASRAAAAALAREPKLGIAELKRRLLEGGSDAAWRAGR